MLKANELIYEKISHHIRSQIEDGVLHPGDRLLSEREMARQFKSSVVTVRKAMKPLIDSGVIEKIHGKGTFVRNAAQTAGTGRLAVLYCQSREGLFASSFYTSLVAGIEGAAAVARKDMLLRSLMRDPGEEPVDVVRQMARETDGIIMVDPPVEQYRHIEKALVPCPVPVVVVNSDGIDQQLDAVVPDNAGDTRTIVSFLAGLGHTRIACVMNHSPRHRDFSYNFAVRQNAYRETMDGLGLQPMEPVILNYSKGVNNATLADPADLSLFFGYDEALKRFNGMFDGPEPVTAVFCTGDEVALFVYKAAYLRGIRIPDDLTVVGYDGITEAALVRPALTTLHTPLHEMGAAAVNRIMEKINTPEGGTETHYRITLPGTLVERKSHRRNDK